MSDLVDPAQIEGIVGARRYYSDDSVVLVHGDCLDVLPTLPDESVHAVVTDPPYGIRFMGKSWDGADIVTRTDLRQSQAAMPDDGKAGENGGYRSPSTEAGRYDLSANAAFGLWCEAWARECLRVLKPGGYLLSFGGSRTWHRLAAAVEDAGFEIRDSIAWLYGSGFPKSLDVSKAIDKAAGAEREKVPATGGLHANANLNDDGWAKIGQLSPVMDSTTPATPDAERWQGWGTALKPAFEPIVVARKPLVGTVAANVLEFGTGALNIDATRVATDDNLNGGAYAETGNRAQSSSLNPSGMNVPGKTVGREFSQPSGRWPTNVLLDDTQAAELDQQSGERKAGGNLNGTEPSRPAKDTYGEYNERREWESYGDTGGASRFFPTFRYEAKAPSSERPRVDGTAHPTVKPLDLMRWLVRLVTPPGGTVLEPFAGSGTTAEACILEGFQCIAIEREADYLPLIVSRLSKPMQLGLVFSEGAS